MASLESLIVGVCEVYARLILASGGKMPMLEAIGKIVASMEIVVGPMSDARINVVHHTCATYESLRGLMLTHAQTIEVFRTMLRIGRVPDDLITEFMLANGGTKH